MIEQPGDDNPSKFSYSDDTKPLEKQRNCWITYTNEQTHEILKKVFIYLHYSQVLSKV